MLEHFRRSKQQEIDGLRHALDQNEFPPALTGSRPSFAQTLKEKGPGAVIAEYKPASPSRGKIGHGFSPRVMAEVFNAGGAAAVSVLTESRYFQASLEYIREMSWTGMPVLRKDFIFDPLQVRQTASTPASALLLIVRMFRDQPGVLEDLAATAAVLNLETVLEVFDHNDLLMARTLHPEIILVNNRDLQTLELDMENSRRLIEHRHSGEVWICASGIHSPKTVREMACLGYDSCLIGTAIMQSNFPLETLRSLVLNGASP